MNWYHLTVKVSVLDYLTKKFEFQLIKGLRL